MNLISEESKGYGKNVSAYYLNIKNPATFDEAFAAFNKYKGQNDAGVKAREYLESLGYDGVIGDDEYIAFNPEQIKLVSNKNPTENPDIRYSVGIKNIRDMSAEEIYDGFKFNNIAQMEEMDYTNYGWVVSSLGNREAKIYANQITDMYNGKPAQDIVKIDDNNYLSFVGNKILSTDISNENEILSGFYYEAVSESKLGRNAFNGIKEQLKEIEYSSYKGILGNENRNTEIQNILEYSIKYGLIRQNRGENDQRLVSNRKILSEHRRKGYINTAGNYSERSSRGTNTGTVSQQDKANAKINSNTQYSRTDISEENFNGLDKAKTDAETTRAAEDVIVDIAAIEEEGQGLSEKEQNALVKKWLKESGYTKTEIKSSEQLGELRAKIQDMMQNGFIVDDNVANLVNAYKNINAILDIASDFKKWGKGNKSASELGSSILNQTFIKQLGKIKYRSDIRNGKRVSAIKIKSYIEQKLNGCLTSVF